MSMKRKNYKFSISSFCFFFLSFFFLSFMFQHVIYVWSFGLFTWVFSIKYWNQSSDLGHGRIHIFVLIIYFIPFFSHLLLELKEISLSFHACAHRKDGCTLRYLLNIIWARFALGQHQTCFYSLYIFIYLKYYWFMF